MYLNVTGKICYSRFGHNKNYFKKIKKRKYQFLTNNNIRGILECYIIKISKHSQRTLILKLSSNVSWPIKVNNGTSSSLTHDTISPTIVKHLWSLWELESLLEKEFRIPVGLKFNILYYHSVRKINSFRFKDKVTFLSHLKF